MSLPPRSRGVKVLKAVSSPLRLQILNLLFDKGALSYTELMNQLKMNPSRDAGRFAYHLKFLLRASLVEVDSGAKKYYLTDLGKMVIDVADRVEKKAVKPKGMMVRTSHFTFEEFDANKIANSLIREAKMPADEAQKTAKETEKLLMKSKIKYLTAALIREIVNVLLIEKGMEDYRHKLTRVGLPVHEVTALIETKNPLEPSPVLSTAGKNVFREYTLLNVLPRDISDAHMSGALHVNGLSIWILKPSEVMHDLRFFLQNGIRLDGINPHLHSEMPPQSFEAALNVAFNMLLFTQQEIAETQTVDYFNIFLAPYARGQNPADIKDKLRLFLLNVNQQANVTLGIELMVPGFLSKKPVTATKDKTNPTTYGDYSQETTLLASLVIDILIEESTAKPLLNPKIVIKTRSETVADPTCQAILLKAHTLAAAKGSLYFARPAEKERTTTYSGSGIKLTADFTEDWETDTMRTGCVGYITINLPRAVQESGKDKTKFFDLIKERVEFAMRAINIKQRALKQYGKTILPFLTQGNNGDTYFRLENCSGIVNFAGFKEAIEEFTAKPFSDKESGKFAVELIQTIQAFINKVGRKHGKRLFPAIIRSTEASARLAQLDVEKYGVAKVKFSGTRDKPFYETTRRLHLQMGNFLSVPSEELEAEKCLKGFNAAGNLSIVDMNNFGVKPEDLQKLTFSLIENHKLDFITYNRAITYCTNCQKSWYGTLHKCLSCGSMGTLTDFDAFCNT